MSVIKLKSLISAQTKNNRVKLVMNCKVTPNFSRWWFYVGKVAKTLRGGECAKFEGGEFTF